MVELIKKASEEIYEIAFSGKFIPERFNPLWFAENKLLGKKEASNAQILTVSEGIYCSFKTDFLEIYVEEDRLRVITKNLQSYDLVNDMAISIGKILADSLYDHLHINLRLHYSFSTEEKLKEVLNKLYSLQDWSEILESPQLLALRVNQLIEKDSYNYEKLISMFPCNRDDMPNTVHLYIISEFLKTNRDIPLYSVLEENESYLFSSIETANNLITKYL